MTETRERWLHRRCALRHAETFKISDQQTNPAVGGDVHANVHPRPVPHVRGELSLQAGVQPS